MNIMSKFLPILFSEALADMSREQRVFEEIKHIPKVMPKGMQKFTINGHVIWALNKKNAIRKVAKLNLQV